MATDAESKKTRSGHRMSLEMASRLFDWSSIALAIGACIVFVATAAIVWLGIVKEHHWDLLREQSNERVASLNNGTAKLTADNLALQTVLLPRHVGLIGFDRSPPASEWFAGFERWAGTKLLIQVISGDPEAKNLADEIAIVLSKFGWKPDFISDSRSSVLLSGQFEGVRVFSPGSYKAWDANNAEQQTFAQLGNARVELARALTRAGLGVGEYRVSDAIIVGDFPPGSDGAASQYGKFSPPLDGIYIQVGGRAVASTVAWIKQGRPDSLGNKAVDAAPAVPHK
jgi:hypothetical protein